MSGHPQNGTQRVAGHAQRGIRMVLRAGGCTLPAAGLLLAALPLAGCKPPKADATAADKRPLVLCTTTMITDLARTLGGDRINVVGIMPPGTDPHTYEPRPDDTILMRRAHLIFYNGLHLEGRMVQMFENAGAKAVALAEDPRIELRESGTAAGAPDPHCWWNARFFRVYAERARDALIQMDPSGAAAYRTAADGYFAQLDEVDAQIRAAVARIPPERRYLITSHDAFAYYGKAYGLHVDAVLGISTDASVRALRPDELARLVVERRIPAIFHETSVSAALNQVVDRVVELAAKRGHTVVVPPTPLYSDSLGPPDSPVGTYLGALRENTRIIVSALSGADVSALLAPKGAGGG
ncbi:MAG: zinc ABC transporter substrate-binding protein [Planctomycetota bacterium]